MSRKKLYVLTEQSFRAFSHFEVSGEIVTIECKDVPMLLWPGGRWCFEANVYMQQLVERGLSRRDGGGTLHTYATQLSPLIRFCHENETDFHELSDAQFTTFVRSLTSKDSAGASPRSNKSAIRIARLSLDFLSEVGQMHRRENFVGPTGRIRAIRVAGVVSASAARREVRNSYWSHRSFPLAEGLTIRQPISQENIGRLRDAVLETSSSPFLRKRRYVLLVLLEATGARRYEISRLQVTDILTAAEMPSPMLKLLTAKQGGNADVHREIPVTHIDLGLIVEYIEKNRVSDHPENLWCPARWRRPANKRNQRNEAQREYAYSRNLRLTAPREDRRASLRAHVSPCVSHETLQMVGGTSQARKSRRFSPFCARQ